MSDEHHSYDAIMQAGAAQQQQERQAFVNAAALAQKYGIELGTELSAELTNPTTYTSWEYEQQVKDATLSSFYEQEMWMNVQPRRNEAKPVDTRPQQDIAYEQYLAEKHKAEQPKEQAEQVQGQNARVVASRLEYGWEDSRFQAYLDSDDDAYMSMRLSPQQIQLANEVWGLDEDTAKAYVYHHKLTPDDLALIEMAFIGQASPVPQAPTHQRDADDSSYAPSVASNLDYPSSAATDSTAGDNPDSAAGYDSVAALNDVDRIRYTYFPKVDNAEWSKILNGVIDEFESLSPEEHEKYTDPMAGFWALHQRVNSQRQQQTQPKPKTQQRQQRQQPKQSSSSAALTPRGYLKQSWINKLSPQQYEQQADRIYQWYAAKKIDFNA